MPLLRETNSMTASGIVVSYSSAKERTPETSFPSQKASQNAVHTFFKVSLDIKNNLKELLSQSPFECRTSLKFITLEPSNYAIFCSRSKYLCAACILTPKFMNKLAVSSDGSVIFLSDSRCIYSYAIARGFYALPSSKKIVLEVCCFGEP